MDTFGFLTDTAENLVGRLLSGVAQDIVAERVGRRSALDRVSEALERASEVDGAQPEQTILDAVALRLSGPFAEAGMLATSGGEIRSKWDAWARGGSASGPQAWAPAAAARAASHAKAASLALERLSEAGVTATVSQVSPSEEGFCGPDGRVPAQVVVYPEDGTFLPGTILGMVVEADGGVCFAEHLPADVDSIVMALGRGEILPGLGERAIPIVAVALAHAREAVNGYRIAVSMAKAPARLGLSLTRARGIPCAFATWDGEPVRHLATNLADAKPPGGRRQPGATEAVRAVAHAFQSVPEEAAVESSSGMTF